MKLIDRLLRYIANHPRMDRLMRCRHERTRIVDHRSERRVVCTECGSYRSFPR